MQITFLSLCLPGSFFGSCYITFVFRESVCSMNKSPLSVGWIKARQDRDLKGREQISSLWFVWSFNSLETTISVFAALKSTDPRVNLFVRINFSLSSSIRKSWGFRDSNLVDSASSIRLSQRLSHACLSINKSILWNCEWLIISVIVYLMVLATWITVVILELIHASNPDSRRDVFIRLKPMRGNPDPGDS